VLRRVSVTMVFHSAIINALYKISLITAHRYNAFVFRLQKIVKKLETYQQLKIIRAAVLKLFEQSSYKHTIEEMFKERKLQNVCLFYNKRLLFNLRRHFFMVPLNLTCLHCLQHFIFAYLFILY